MLDIVESVVFFGIGPLLWASGPWLFMRSTHSRRRKVIWTLMLISVGAVIGFVLPLDMIRQKFLLLLFVLPVLAIVDVALAKSNRSFAFWFRACSFEIYTVCGAAAMFRYILDALKLAALI